MLEPTIPHWLVTRNGYSVHLGDQEEGVTSTRIAMAKLPGGEPILGATQNFGNDRRYFTAGAVSFGPPPSAPVRKRTQTAFLPFGGERGKARVFYILRFRNAARFFKQRPIFNELRCRLVGAKAVDITVWSTPD